MRSGILALFVLAVPSAVSQPRGPIADPAEALIRRGHRAERYGVYSGVKVIRASCSSTSSSDYERMVRIWHGGPRRTRLEFLPTKGRRFGRKSYATLIVIENGSCHWLYSPKEQTWRPLSWCEPQSHLELLLRNYHLTLEDVETVAARRARRIRIEPRHAGNPSKRTWLDLETGVPLRSELFASSGRRVSTMQYLEFRPERSLPAQLFQVPEGASASSLIQHPESGVQSAVRLSFEPAQPRYLPRGYVLDRESRSRRDGVEMSRARYTDGLNVLSLVQWRGPLEGEPDAGREQFWSAGEQIHWSRAGIRATLSGDLEARELRRIVDSIPVPRSLPDRRFAKRE
jgi:outer membrane lipoprotein-sorting protein